MKGAEPGGVVEACRAAVPSEADVVQLDAFVAAAWEHATAAVALVGGAALGGGELVVGHADVEDFTAAAEHHRDELGVAGEPAHRLRREAAVGGGDPGLAQPAFESLEVDGDDH